MQSTSVKISLKQGYKMGMQKIAIIGASGFIGKHLLAKLGRMEAEEVRVLSRNSSRLKNQMNESVQVIEGDLMQIESLQALVQPGCTVINLAYLRDAGADANFYAMDNLLKVCQSVGVARVIHCSTADLVGRAATNNITEETVCHPVNEYGITKLELERRVIRAGLQNSFDTVVLRPTAVFGSDGEQLKKLLSDLMVGNTWVNYAKACLFGERRMNLVHVENVVEAIVFLIRYPKPLNGEVFIVSDDDEPNNNFAYVEQFLIDKVAFKPHPLLRVRLPAIILSALLAIRGRNNINPYCNYDSGKLLGLGFKKVISLEDGLAEYARWHQSKERGEQKVPIS